MDRTIQVLRLKMDGRWLADELGSCVSDLAALYDLRMCLELMREDQRDWEHFFDELWHFGPMRRQFKRRFLRGQMFPTPFPTLSSAQIDVTQLSALRAFLEPSERLEIRRLNYASPGASDLAGVGAIVGHVKDFVVKLIDRHDTRRQRELNDDRAAAEIDRIRLENARNFVALGKDLGYSDIEMRKLVAQVDEKQDMLISLIDQKKLTGATIVGDGESDSNNET
jgi:hypothetical protein